MKTVSEIMTFELITVTENISIGKISEMMVAASIEHMPVIDDNGKLIGILSDKDINRIVSPFVGHGDATEKDKLTLEIKAKTVMLKDLHTCSDTDEIKHCAELMLQHSVHCIPVVDSERRISGIVTSSDIILYSLNYIG